ncbi:MAG: glycosyltransferase [Paludibacter sp.]|nr:glycosyltransferase [Paludibacter sp.]
MKILVCPLNWGLGHATRCIPLIKELIAGQHEVVVASDGHPLQLLKEVFPDLRFIHSTSYNIRYNKGKSQVTAMFRSLPKIFYGIVREHRWLHQLNKQEHFDQVISDNRFGLWNKNIHSIYMTHQLMVKMPALIKFMEPFVWLGHRSFITRYDECLVPDYSGAGNLSGDLSHRYPLPRHVQFIGPLSRFTDVTIDTSIAKAYDTVVLISGPEPQRTLFEEQMIRIFLSKEEKVLIVQGLPGNKKIETSQGNITLVPHIPTEVMAAHLKLTKTIICRSGYSTIMDLVIIDCLHKAIFIPTPGQTEQEYLAKYLHKKTAGKLPAACVN